MSLFCRLNKFMVMPAIIFGSLCTLNCWGWEDHPDRADFKDTDKMLQESSMGETEQGSLGTFENVRDNSHDTASADNECGMIGPPDRDQ